MQDMNPPTPSEAWAIAHDPQATPEQLSLVAQHHPSLDAVVAAHPQAYPDLLDWLAQYGSEAAQQAVAARRAAQDPKPATLENPAGTAASVTTPSSAPIPPDPDVAASDRATAAAPPPESLYPPPPLMAPVPAPKAPAKIAAPLVIAGITVVGIIALAVVVMTTPVLSWLGLGNSTTSTTSQGWNDPAGADYANGAVPKWTLDLAQQYPGEDLSFTFGPILDDAWHWSRYSPLEIGTIWIAPYTPQSDPGAKSDGGLLGLDRATGKVLWRDKNLTHCATVPIKDELPCLTAHRDAQIAMVSVKTGAVRMLNVEGSVDYLAVAGQNLVVVSESTDKVTLTAVSGDGSVQWRQTLPDYEGGIYQDPIVEGDYLMLVSLGGFSVVRVSDGAHALNATETLAVLLPHGHLVMDRAAPAAAESGQAGLKVVTVAGLPRLLTDTGHPVLYVSSSQEGSPDQWCPDLDPAKCETIPHSGSIEIGAVVTENKPPYFTDQKYQHDGSFDLSTGKQVADYSSSYHLFMGGYLNDGRIRIQNTYESPRIDMYDTLTGKSIGSITDPGWYPLSRMPGGRLILTHASDTDGFVTTRITMYAPATEPGTGLKEPTETSSTPPSGSLPSCPSGSIQLAYATFPDGWVLVCGINATTPTQWYSSDSAGELSSTSVSYDPTSYRYTAQFSDGTSGWLNHTPGVFGHTSGSGQILTQRSVGQIWFVALDSGSTAPASAPSTGPFGVPLPQATAEDQVRYLSALLQKSAAARKALQPAVIAVRECENGSNGDYSSQVSTISSVTDNRKELLSALETAPVDKVPNGTALVSELRTALSYSLRADQAYLAWATAVNNSGCGSGSETEGTKNSKRAGTAKETFVKHWNAQISGPFSAPTFTRDQL